MPSDTKAERAKRRRIKAPKNTGKITRTKARSAVRTVRRRKKR